MDEMNQNQTSAQQTTQQNSYPQPAHNISPFEEPVYVAPVATAPQKSSATKWIIIGVAGILVIAAIVVILFLFVFNNKSAYEKAERNSIDHLTKAFSAEGDDGADMEAIFNQRTKIDIALTTENFPPEIQEAVQTYVNLSILNESVKNGDSVYSQSTYTMGGAEILNQKLWYQLKDNIPASIICKLVNVSDVAFVIESLDSLTQASAQADEETQKMLESLYEDVLNAYFSYTAKYPVESGKSFTTENATYEADLVVVNFTYEDVFGLIKEICGKLYNNDKFFEWFDNAAKSVDPSVLKPFQSQMGNMSAAEYLRSLVKSIADGALDSMASMMPDEQRLMPIFTMNVYIRNDVIACREIKVNGDVIRIVTVLDENVTDVALEATVGGSEAFSVSAYNTKTDDKNSGTVSASQDNVPLFTVTYNNLRMTADEIDGAVNVIAGSANLDINFTTTVNGSDKVVSGTIGMGGKQYATITTTTGPSTLAYEEPPVIDSSNSVNFADMTTTTELTPAMEQFANDINAFIEELATKNPIFSLFAFSPMTPDGGDDYFGGDFSGDFSDYEDYFGDDFSGDFSDYEDYFGDDFDSDDFSDYEDFFSDSADGSFEYFTF